VPDYRLVSADSHVNEPPGVWRDRVPAEFRDRAPRIESFDEGDAWVIEGVRDPINFGWNACAGLAPEEMKAWARFEELRPGGHDPAARVAEMDRDRVDAEVLYPTPRLSQAIVANTDAEFHLACIRAYNDWLSEYVEYAPRRFGGLALLPNRGGSEGAVAEIARVADRPGIRGFLMGCYPNGTLHPSADDDKVWRALTDRRMPLNIHVSLSQTFPASHRSPLPGYGRFFDAPNRMIEMIFSGMLDRFPDLKIAFAETDFGWLPYVKEQVDNNYLRLAVANGYDLDLLPSEYIERHFWFGFITDTFGIGVRDRVGHEHVMWSSDYPHISADWPNSWRTIEAAFSGVPRAERDAMLAGNAVSLYGFDPGPERPSERNT
jgi:predicted TIM-barrel fold metal-dependent hydrolase